METNQYLVVESVQRLIAAVNEYGEKLKLNGQILLDAGNMCDAAMGSDDNAKKHMRKLEDALGELNKAVEIVYEVSAELQRDLMRAIDTNND